VADEEEVHGQRPVVGLLGELRGEQVVRAQAGQAGRLDAARERRELLGARERREVGAGDGLDREARGLCGDGGGDGLGGSKVGGLGQGHRERGEVCVFGSDSGCRGGGERQGEQDKGR
jgi:hypothetical protein